MFRCSSPPPNHCQRCPAAATCQNDPKLGDPPLSGLESRHRYVVEVFPYILCCSMPFFLQTAGNAHGALTPQRITTMTSPPARPFRSLPRRALASYAHILAARWEKEPCGCGEEGVKNSRLVPKARRELYPATLLARTVHVSQNHFRC
jgi:hypothetical protein